MMSHLKKTVFYSLLVSLMFISQLGFTQSVNGNGNVTTETFELDPFSSVEVKGVLNVYISQGLSEELTIKTDENLMQYIEFEVRNGHLTLNTKPNAKIKKSTEMNMYLTISSIDALTLSGVGTVKSDGPLKMDYLDLQCSSVGNTSLEIVTDKLDARTSMVGNFDLSGRADFAKIKNSAVGNLNAFDFKVKHLDINSSGVGSTRVYASEDISVTSTGIGGVKIKGNPQINEMKKRGIGSVKKI